MALTLITPPAVEPISLAEAKAHLRVAHTDEDSTIAIYIRAAREFVDGPYAFLGRALVTQTWDLTLDEFPLNEIKIPLPPLQSITTITYDDSTGSAFVMNSADYYVDIASEPGWVVPVEDWPITLDAINSVRIRFVAGYAANTDSPPDLTANIPFNIKAAMLLIIGTLYENREQNFEGIINKLPFGADALLRSHRVQLGMA